MMSRIHSHTFPNHGSHMLKQLNVQRYYGAFCDILVKVQDIEFKLHKCLLSAASSKLQNMILQLHDNNSDALFLKELTVNGFRGIVEYIYTGVLKVEALHVPEVYDAAQYLDIQEVQKACGEFFKSMQESMGHETSLPPLEAALGLMRMSGTGGSYSQQHLLPPMGHLTGLPAFPGQHESNVAVSGQVLPQTMPPPSSTPMSLPGVSLPHTLPSSQSLPPLQVTCQTASTTPQMPLPSISAVSAGLGMDTNYIEDYLKLIECMQNDPTSTNKQQPPVPAARPPPPPADALEMYHSVLQHSQPQNHVAPATPTPNNITTASLDLPPHPQTVISSPSVKSTMSSSTTAVPPRMSSYTAEEVKKTVLSVLSHEKFDDDDDEDEENDTGDNNNRQKESIPLTSLLNFAPLNKPEMKPKLKYAQRSFSKDGSEKEEDGEEEEEESAADEKRPVTQETTGDGGSASEYEFHDDETDDDDDEDDDDDDHDESLDTSGTTNEEETKPIDEIKSEKDDESLEGDDSMMDENDQNCDSIQKIPSSRRLLDSLKRSGKRTCYSYPMIPMTMKNGKGRGGVGQRRGTRGRRTGTARAMISQASSTASAKPLKKRLKSSKSSMITKTKYPCPKCGRLFGKSDALERHISMHDSTEMSTCHVCSQKFARTGELTRHMRMHTGEIYRCRKCSAEYLDTKMYRKHMETVHGEAKAFYCAFPGCNFRSDKLSNVEKHTVIHSGIRAYGCPNCGKFFAQQNGLRSHMRSCYQERGFLCDICGQKFNHLHSMKSHRRIHTGEKPHRCGECTATFTDHRNFKRHMRIHRNSFPYTCEHCDKKFRHSNSLKAHQYTHTGGRKKSEESVGSAPAAPKEEVPQDYGAATSVQANVGTPPEQKLTNPYVLPEQLMVHQKMSEQYSMHTMSHHKLAEQYAIHQALQKMPEPFSSAHLGVHKLPEEYVPQAHLAMHRVPEPFNTTHTQGRKMADEYPPHTPAHIMQE